MQKTCKATGKVFEVTDEDLAFYDKVSPVINGEKLSIATPTLCPEERLRRRLAWRNERSLYKRKCDLTGKEIISSHSPEKEYPVYDHKEWYGDKWNPLDYGRDFDFNRTFFEQFEELLYEVPQISLLRIGDDINSDFAHDAFRLKNCYLIFDGEQAEDCYYGETFLKTKDSCDFFFLTNSELTYECINCDNCYNVKYSRHSYSCSNSSFLLDCIGCKNCFGCVNLHQKEYHIFNKPYSKEEYERIIKEFDLGSYQKVQEMKAKVEAWFKTQPKRAFRGKMNEEATGDNIIGCKNTYESYDCFQNRDCKFCTNLLLDANDCYDVTVWGNHLSKAYECLGTGEGAENMIASYYVGMSGHNVYHSYFCFKNVNNLLGCVGLIHKHHCILNKQFEPEEYEKQAAKIIKHMQKTGEWGEFFPIEMSLFGYNETGAQEYYPITKEEAQRKGYKWKEPDKADYQAQTYKIPDHINDVPDSICDEILACEVTGKNYKITKQELAHYRKMQIPIPHRESNQRHYDRVKLRNPRQLWQRNCAKCQTSINSTYSSAREEIIYCKKCYQEYVFK